MKKISSYLIIILFCILLCGCNNKKEQVVLEDKYYNSGGFIESNYNDVSNLLRKKESFILFAYNNYCNLPYPCEKIFEKYMEDNNIRFVSIPFKDFKKLLLYNTVKYVPTIIIIDKGNIVTYLDAESDEDFNRYQDEEEFSKWIEQYLVK